MIVEENHAPGYYNIITNPMDFSTIRRKLEVSLYTRTWYGNLSVVLLRIILNILEWRLWELYRLSL